MNTIFKSALNKIKAEDELVEKTEEQLRNSNLNPNKGKIIELRSVYPMKKMIKAAGIAAVLCGLAAGGFAFSKIPVSYLSLDINPSVELGINAFNKVVSAAAYNEDGKTILDGRDILNTDVQDAVNALVKSADDNGFIADDGSTIVAVTSETDNDKKAEEIENEAEQGANEAIEETGNTAVVYKDNVALARRDEARKLGITPGKLNLIQKLMALDPTATVEQYKNARVTVIMKKVVELKKAGKNAAVNPEEQTTSATITTVDTTAGISATTFNTADINDVNADIQKIEKAVAQSDKNKKDKANNGKSKSESNEKSTGNSQANNGNGKKSSGKTNNGNSSAAKTELKQKTNNGHKK